jgi:hypothetical protein
LQQNLPTADSCATARSHRPRADIRWRCYSITMPPSTTSVAPLTNEMGMSLPAWQRGPRQVSLWRSRLPDGEPDRPLVLAIGRTDPPPTDIRSRRCGPRHSGFVEAPPDSGELASISIRVPLSKPTTGIDGCCARAVIGHVTAAPPSSVMNSRRPNSLNCIRSPRPGSNYRLSNSQSSVSGPRVVCRAPHERGVAYSHSGLRWVARARIEHIVEGTP